MHPCVQANYLPGPSSWWYICKVGKRKKTKKKRHHRSTVYPIHMLVYRCCPLGQCNAMHEHEKKKRNKCDDKYSIMIEYETRGKTTLSQANEQALTSWMGEERKKWRKQTMQCADQGMKCNDSPILLEEIKNGNKLAYSMRRCMPPKGSIVKDARHPGFRPM